MFEEGQTIFRDKVAAYKETLILERVASCQIFTNESVSTQLTHILPSASLPLSRNENEPVTQQRAEQRVLASVNSFFIPENRPHRYSTVRFTETRAFSRSNISPTSTDRFIFTSIEE